MGFEAGEGGLGREPVQADQLQGDLTAVAIRIDAALTIGRDAFAAQVALILWAVQAGKGFERLIPAMMWMGRDTGGEAKSHDPDQSGAKADPRRRT